MSDLRTKTIARRMFREVDAAINEALAVVDDMEQGSQERRDWSYVISHLGLAYARLKTLGDK